MQRRRFLYAVVAGSGLAAGCVADSSGQNQPSSTSAEQTPTNTPTTTEESTASTQTTETTTHRHTPTTEGTRTESTQTNTPKEPTEETQKTAEQGDQYTPLTDHYHSDTIVYDHDQLRLHACDSAVRPGETTTFTITNTGDSSITLGCHNPTTIQKQVDGEWRDVVWTAANAYLACATVLQAGHSTSEEVTVARDALKSSNKEVRIELTPGQYRFVLLATDPYLAADFHVREKTTERNSSTAARGCTTEDR